MPRTALAILTLLAFAVAATAQPPAQPVPVNAAVRPADPALAAVPTDSFLFVSVKASKLWDNPAAKPFRDWIAAQKERPFDAVIGLDPAEVDRLTLFAGTTALGAALIFFVAANWAAIGRFGKFALVEAVVIAAVGIYAALGPERASGKAALLVATLALGALLAFVGQTYQTGADTFELFSSWAAIRRLSGSQAA